MQRSDPGTAPDALSPRPRRSIGQLQQHRQGTSLPSPFSSLAGLSPRAARGASREARPDEQHLLQQQQESSPSLQQVPSALPLHRSSFSSSAAGGVQRCCCCCSRDSCCNRMAGCCRPGRSLGCSRETAARLALLLLLIAGVVLVALTVDVRKVEAVLLWMDEAPVQGSICFILAYTIAVTLLFPGSILALAAGAVFGVLLGSFVVWVGTVLGQTLSFVLSRYLLRHIVVDYTTKKYPKWAAIDAAVSQEAWKLIMLLRLSPIVPWNVLNYALAVTGVGLWPYTVSSAVAVIPWNVSFAYFGSLAHTLADVLEGRAGPNRQTALVLLVLSGVMLAVAVWWTTIISKRAIREALLESTGPGASDLVSSSLDGLSLIGAAAEEQRALEAGQYSSPVPAAPLSVFGTPASVALPREQSVTLGSRLAERRSSGLHPEK